MKIAFIPIDDRPVCYTLPQQIVRIDKSVELLIPPREWLGNLTRGADTDKILDWIEKLPPVDACVVALDTIAYGGLIPSRRSSDSLEQIKSRLNRLRACLPANTHAFSSIMRISNNNINEEEKEYWSTWGKKIFAYSFTRGEHDIPAEILDDYLATRRRNFEINKLYLDWNFKTIVFSKDDCAQAGFNVDEAKELEALGAFVKTGADEMPLALLSRALNPRVKIKPIFLEPNQKHLVSNYEDISIEESVRSQIELARCVIDDEPDLLLYVNNFVGHQGEIVMKVDTKPFDGVWQKPDKPYMVADVRFANGADNAFVQQLLAAGELAFDKNFYGYSAWNTSANTLGSLICAACVKFHAQNSYGLYDDEAFKRLQAVRFLDDWAYQANVRQGYGKMSDFEQKLKCFLKKPPNYRYPWDRAFEIEVIV
jgi:hypothetical protein